MAKVDVLTNKSVVAVIVTLVADCATVGVPEITPVAELIDIPAGSVVLEYVGESQNPEIVGAAIVSDVFCVMFAEEVEIVGSTLMVWT